MHWADVVLMLAMVAAGCVTTYFLVERKLRQTLLERQRELENRVSTLIELIRSLEGRIVEAGPDADAVAVQDVGTGLTQGSVNPSDRLEQDEIPGEIRAAIVASAVALFGRHARVVSARPMRPDDAVSPWSRQGRLIVQSSHNLRSRG